MQINEIDNNFNQVIGNHVALLKKKKEKKRKEYKRKQRSLSREISSAQAWPPHLFFFGPTSHLSMLLENFTVVY